MLRPDRAVALALLAFAIGYGLLAWDYPLLPFERAMPFKPNTLPKGLAVVAALLSVAVLLFPGGAQGEERGKLRHLDWRRTGGVFVLALLYAATLRPLGFLLSTALFLFLGAILLGERRVKLLIIVPVIAALLSWWLVQEALGVFLSPLPAFL